MRPHYPTTLSASGKWYGYENVTLMFESAVMDSCLCRDNRGQTRSVGFAHQLSPEGLMAARKQASQAKARGLLGHLEVERAPRGAQPCKSSCNKSGGTISPSKRLETAPRDTEKGTSNGYGTETET